MAFSWDAENADHPKQELQLSITDEEIVCCSSQLEPALNCSPHVLNLKVGGSPERYHVDLNRLWSANPAQGDAEQGQAMEPLTALEDFMTHSRTILLRNPTWPIT